MSLIELLIIALGVSMDAFAVSVCAGLTMKKLSFKKALVIGIYFGAFQLLMPLIGYIAGAALAGKIARYDHWATLILLSFIGIKMIYESFRKEDTSDEEVSIRFRNMLPLAIATSIDALAVGVSFSFLKVSIIPAVSLIGAITMLLSMLGVKIGHVFGSKYSSVAERIGGIILVLIGVKIFLEHMGVLPF